MKEYPTCLAYSTQSLTIPCHVEGRNVCTTRKDVVYGHIGLGGSFSGASANDFSGLGHCQRSECVSALGERLNTHLLQVGIIVSRTALRSTNGESRTVYSPAQTEGKGLRRGGQYMTLPIIVGSHFIRTTCFARKLRMTGFASATGAVSASC